MRLEQIPLFIGVVVAILGLGLVLDAQLPEGFSPSRERRRRERTERHRGGETLVGLGIVGAGIIFASNDPVMKLDDTNFGWQVFLGSEFTPRIRGDLRFIASDSPGDDQDNDDVL